LRSATNACLWQTDRQLCHSKDEHYLAKVNKMTEPALYVKYISGRHKTEPKPNQTHVFSKPKLSFKNPFRTFLVSAMANSMPYTVMHNLFTANYGFANSDILSGRPFGGCALELGNKSYC